MAKAKKAAAGGVTIGDEHLPEAWTKVTVRASAGGSSWDEYLYFKTRGARVLECRKSFGFTLDPVRVYTVTDSQALHAEPKGVGAWLAEVAQLSAASELDWTILHPESNQTLSVLGGRLKETTTEWAFSGIPPRESELADDVGRKAAVGWSRLAEVTTVPKQLDFDTLLFELIVAGKSQEKGLLIHRIGTTWVDSFDLQPADFQSEIKVVFKKVVTGTLPATGQMKFAAQKLYATTSKGTECTHRVLYSDNGQLLGYLNVAKSLSGVTSITWFINEAVSTAGGGYVINRTRPLVIQPIAGGATLPSGTWYSATTPRFLV